MKILQAPVQLIFAIILALTSQIASVSVAVARKNSELPEPPPTGTPEENSFPGGTRGPDDIACQKTQKPLTSILGENIRDFTVSAYPTFWFYIPYDPEKISNLEFVLRESGEEREIYRTQVKRAEKPGIVKVKIPEENKYSLKPEKDYYWSLTVQCNPKQQEVLQGWIHRVPLTSQLKRRLKKMKSRRYVAYIEGEIMYDAVTNLVALQLSNPQNPQYKKAWNDLLKLLGLKYLADEPFVDSVLIQPEKQVTANFRRE